MTTIYLIGSLRNTKVPLIGREIRKHGYDVFDDWHSAGPDADDHLRDYEKARGHDFVEALDGYAARHIFALDLHHIRRADCGVLVTPAGKSGHLELGYILGSGKPAYILLNKEPERIDVMYQFATGIYRTLDELLEALNERY